MPTWLCVHLSRPGLDAYRYSTPEDWLVVVSQGRVQACGSLAWKAGVRPGMRQSGALTLAPDAQVVAEDPVLERQLRDELALTLLPFTPLLSWMGRDSLVLDLSASLALFGGVRRLYGRIRASLDVLNLGLQLALAPSARGAWLLARAAMPGRRRVLRPASLAACLDGLPLTLLQHGSDAQAWLQGLGCSTLGAVRRLPRAGLRQREAAAMLLELDRAYGDMAEPMAWVLPPEQFASQVQSLFPVERQDAILWLAQRLMERLCAWLDARQLAVTAVRWTLHHETRRRSLPRVHIDLALAQPAWQPGHLLRLLTERLGAMRLLGPISALALEARAWQARPDDSGSLLAESGNAADSATLLEILAARLGAEQVLQACPLADHRPEKANHWQPFQDAVMPDLPQAVALDGRARPERPFWLLEQAVPLAVQQGRPVYGGVLSLLAGPERIEDGWWDGLAARDYFVAEDAGSGARYWIFRVREAGADSHGEGWFLHGIYA